MAEISLRDWYLESLGNENRLKCEAFFLTKIVKLHIL